MITLSLDVVVAAPLPLYVVRPSIQSDQDEFCGAMSAILEHSPNLEFQENYSEGEAAFINESSGKGPVENSIAFKGDPPPNEAPGILNKKRVVTFVMKRIGDGPAFIRWNRERANYRVGVMPAKVGNAGGVPEDQIVFQDWSE